MTRRALAVRWPAPGRTELVEEAVGTGPGELAVETVLSVANPGTERARFLALPNAAIGFPHGPGFGAVGHALDAAPGVPAGALVAVRSAPHQSVVMAPLDRVRVLAPGTEPTAAALWQVGLIALHGLGVGGHRPDEPLTVVGAGLIGAVVRRIALARGSTACTVLATSTAKRWSVEPEPATRFVTAEPGGASGAGAERRALVVDATGTAAGLLAAVDATEDGGRVVLLGSPRIPAAAVPVEEIRRRGLRLVGAHIDTLPDHSARTGEDLLARYTEEHFALIGGPLALADLVTVFTPGQAELMYQQLVDDPALVGAAVAWSAPARPLRFALVGCGDIGAESASALGRTSRSTLVSCLDTDATLSAALAGPAGARVADGLDAVLADPEVDAVLVATPHDTHEPIATAVLAAGKHLLLQKPLAADLPAAGRIAAAARAASTTAGVLFPGRYEEAYRCARRAVAEGRLGDPLGVVATYLVHKPATYYRGGYSGRAVSSWRLSKERSGGGILVMNLLHHLDLVRSLLGVEAEWVSAQTVDSVHSPEIEDVAALIVRFGPAVATLVGAATVPGGPGEGLRLWGTSGHGTVIPRWTFSPADGSAVELRRRPEPDDPHAAALDAFATAAQEGRPPDVTIEDALAVQAIVTAAYESARTGQAVRPFLPARAGVPG